MPKKKRTIVRVKKGDLRLYPIYKAEPDLSHIVHALLATIDEGKSAESNASDEVWDVMPAVDEEVAKQQEETLRGVFPSIASHLKDQLDQN